MATEWSTSGDKASGLANGNVVLNCDDDGGDSTRRIVFQGAGTEHMRMERDGNFGIGTTSPNEKLEVAGTIRANTRFNTNGVDGATGSFTTADGKTVTVSGGIITEIV